MFVNVTQTIRYGLIFWLNKYKNLSTNTVVLPVPAADSTNTYELVASTAAFCISFIINYIFFTNIEVKGNSVSIKRLYNIIMTRNIEEFDFGMPKIKIIGVGGGGCNAVEGIRRAISNFHHNEHERLMQEGGKISQEDIIRLPEDSFIVANTDVQNLRKCQSKIKIQLGENGRGAGADPALGKKAAEFSADKIREAISDANLVIIVSAFGGGTGTGAAPIIAKTIKECEQKPIVLGIVTLPFMFEGQNKIKIAKTGIKEFSQNADVTVVISNQLLFRVAHETLGIQDAFGIVDNTCAMFVNGIIQVLAHNGLINLDFADLTTTLSEKGFGSLGIGIGTGDSAAITAVTQALSSKLLETSSIKEGTNFLIHIVGNNLMSLDDLQDIMNYITNDLGENKDHANIIHGASIVSTEFCRNEHAFYNQNNKNKGYDESDFFDENKKWIRVLIIATGLKNMQESNTQASPAPRPSMSDNIMSNNSSNNTNKQSNIFDLVAKRWVK